MPTLYGIIHSEREISTFARIIFYRNWIFRNCTIFGFVLSFKCIQKSHYFHGNNAFKPTINAQRWGKFQQKIKISKKLHSRFQITKWHPMLSLEIFKEKKNQRVFEEIIFVKMKRHWKNRSFAVIIWKFSIPPDVIINQCEIGWAYTICELPQDQRNVRLVCKMQPSALIFA